jgi:hypothetical protein
MNCNNTIMDSNTLATADEVVDKVIVDLEEEDVVACSGPGGKNWPKMNLLCTKHSEIVLKLLRAVHEHQCTEEVNAVNGDNVKGNKWTALYDHCYAGDRGLLAGHLRKLQMPSKLKQKVQSIWEYLKQENTNQFTVIDKKLIQVGLNQWKEYEKTKAEEKEAADKQKNNDAIIQKEMLTFEKDSGAYPPGAMGIEGSGRSGQSTNLKTHQPASFSYANMTTRPTKDNDVIDLEDDEPKAAKKAKTNVKKAKAKASVSATTTNGAALENLMDINTTLKESMTMFMVNKAGDKKRKRMQAKLDGYEKQALHYQKFPDNPKMQAKLEEVNDKFMALSEEMNALDSDGED